VLGGNGSGKTTFLKLIRGEVWPSPGSNARRTYAFDGAPQTSAVGIRQLVALVSPELQQRYLRQEWNLTTRQVIDSGIFQTDYLYQRPTAVQRAAAESAIQLLGVHSLLRRPVQALSTGELRKVLIARALAGSPRVLVCDEICDGLDAASRGRLIELLQRVAENGTQLLVATHRAAELPPCISHRVVLNAGRLHPSPAPRASPRPPLPRKPPHTPAVPSVPSVPALIDITDADVFLDGRRVLRRIRWQLRPGEHWAFLGPNGAGKSTLLKLIAGDVHPAAGGRVRRFGLAPPDTLWDLRRKIGVVSPELQTQYQARLTGAKVIASGFFSSVGLIDRVSAARARRVRELVREFALERLAARSMEELSYGEMRQLLLARALVHRPWVLIFDEPFDGLDAAAKGTMSAALDRVTRNGTQLIVVTHHRDELPACVTHAALLENGRIVGQGRYA
jgi:molybdate transport system ATP-binding protein